MKPRSTWAFFCREVFDPWWYVPSHTGLTILFLMAFLPMARQHGIPAWLWTSGLGVYLFGNFMILGLYLRNAWRRAQSRYFAQRRWLGKVREMTQF